MKILLQQRELLEKKLSTLEVRYQLLRENKKNESKHVDYDYEGFTDTGVVDLSYQVMNIHNQIEETRSNLNNCEIVNSTSDTIQVGSIFTLTFSDEDYTSIYALSEISTMINGIDIITTESQIGKLVLGKKADECFTANINGTLRNIRIDNIQIVKENQKKIEK